MKEELNPWQRLQLVRDLLTELGVTIPIVAVFKWWKVGYFQQIVLDQIEKLVLRALKIDIVGPWVLMAIFGTTICQTIVDGGLGANVLPKTSWISLGRLEVVAPHYSIRLAN